MSGKESRGRRPSWRPWTALLVPPATWYVFEVGLGSVLKVRCDKVGDWLGVGWGVGSLLVCFAAVAVAWPLARDRGAETPSRMWLARVALLLSGIFALAILFQTLAVLIVPACVS